MRHRNLIPLNPVGPSILPGETSLLAFHSLLLPPSPSPSPLQPPPRDDSANLPSRWGAGGTRVKKITMSDYKAPTVGQGPGKEIRVPLPALKAPLADRPAKAAGAAAGVGRGGPGLEEGWLRDTGRWVALPGRRARGRATVRPEGHRGSTRGRWWCCRPGPRLSWGEQKGKGGGSAESSPGGYPPVPATPGAPGERGLQAVPRK